MSIFYHTLRVNKQKGHFFSRGSWLTMIMTTKCNHHCEGCPMFFGQDRVPKFEECSAAEWIQFFEEYPEWISFVALSGGEPSLRDDMHELVNYLLKRGTHVQIYTNLFKLENLLKVNNSPLLAILPCYKHADDPGLFTANHSELVWKGYKTYPFEVEWPLVLPFTRFKGKWSEDYIKTFRTLHVGPNAPRTLRVYLGCDQLYAEGK